MKANFNNLRSISSAFTLIELLIVVAIIAILAAIAVPNFLEAQTRSKISAMSADIRSLAVALEAYNVDHNKYPPDGGHGASPYFGLPCFVPLTTPIAFLTSISRDVFQQNYNGDPKGFYGYPCYVHIPEGQQLPPQQNSIRYRWCVYSIGPDRQTSYYNLYPITGAYDPTNGTVSKGDIGRMEIGRAHV